MKPDAIPFLPMARQCMRNPHTVAAILQHIEDPQEKRRYVSTLDTYTIIEACRVLGYLSERSEHCDTEDETYRAA